MFELTVQNGKGEQLRLTDNKNYDVLEVSGISPPPAAISTKAIAGMDGTRFSSSRVEQRNIVITLNIHSPIEDNRTALYNFFRVKRYIKLYFATYSRNVWIEGYVESFENNHFAPLQKPVISIICPDPYWKSGSITRAEFRKVKALFEFPFESPPEIIFSELETVTETVINSGDVPTGAIIEIKASGDVSNPQFSNLTTGESFGIEYDLTNGDRVVLNTCTGEKSVILYRGTFVLNLLQYRTEGSSWVQLESGENNISFKADEGTEYLTVSVEAVQKFEGV